MGLLDSRERILDIVLTNKGRERLSKNQLNFTYYAFSDEGIDYSGSLDLAKANADTFDNVVHRNFAFEADQRKQSTVPGPGGLNALSGNLTSHTAEVGLKTFLFTIPSKSRVLPELVSSQDENSSIELKRNYSIDQITLESIRSQANNPIGIVARATVLKETADSRLENYSFDQSIQHLEERVLNDENVVGFPLGEDLVLISETQVLNTDNGDIVSISDIIADKSGQKIVSMKKEAEIVAGLDTQKITFGLKNSEGLVGSDAGFLIEVFESGSDGRLKKLNRDSVQSLGGDNSEEGFNVFLNLSVDV